uniref:Uncharacterized protein n=1 Tax=Triticum urartu TaxID=4572 RepID=A0A8R7QLU5_TRIUA
MSLRIAGKELIGSHFVSTLGAKGFVGRRRLSSRAAMSKMPGVTKHHWMPFVFVCSAAND